MCVSVGVCACVCTGVHGMCMWAHVCGHGTCECTVGACVHACMGIGFTALSIILWKINEIVTMKHPKKHKVLC